MSVRMEGHVQCDECDWKDTERNVGGFAIDKNWNGW